MNTWLLLRKDLRLHWRMLLPLIALEIASYIAYAVQMPSAIPGVAFGLLHGVALIGDFLICHRTLISEEKNRAFRYIKALPVSTREIVLAKFAVNFFFVSINTLALLAAWAVARGAGWIHAAPALSVTLFLMALTLHCLNNAFFLATGLIFDSTHAVWIPFPALFLLMSLILNFAQGGRRPAYPGSRPSHRRQSRGACPAGLAGHRRIPGALLPRARSQAHLCLTRA